MFFCATQDSLLAPLDPTRQDEAEGNFQELSLWVLSGYLVFQRYVCID